MGSVSNEIIYRRLSDAIDDSIVLARAANADTLVYLFEMARLELRVLRNHADPTEDSAYVAVRTRKKAVDLGEVEKIVHSLGELLRQTPTPA